MKYILFLDINPALAALLMSYAVNSLGLLDWTMRLSAELENQVLENVFNIIVFL